MPIKNDEGLITLTSDDVLDFALDTLLKGVKLYINGRKCTAENVWEIILKASAGHTAVNDVCDDLVGAPNGNTVLGKVHAGLAPGLEPTVALGSAAQPGAVVECAGAVVAGAV